MEQRNSLRLTLNKGILLLFRKKIVASIYRFVTDSHLRDIA